MGWACAEGLSDKKCRFPGGDYPCSLKSSPKLAHLKEEKEARKRGTKLINRGSLRALRNERVYVGMGERIRKVIEGRKGKCDRSQE